MNHGVTAAAASVVERRSRDEALGRACSAFTKASPRRLRYAQERCKRDNTPFGRYRHPEVIG